MALPRVGEPKLEEVQGVGPTLTTALPLALEEGAVAFAAVCGQGRFRWPA